MADTCRHPHCGQPIGRGLRPGEWWHVKHFKNGRSRFTRQCRGRKTYAEPAPKETP